MGGCPFQNGNHFEFNIGGLIYSINNFLLGRLKVFKFNTFSWFNENILVNPKI